MTKQFELLKVNDPETGLVDLELYFYTQVLKLESLHYGYWENSQDLTLANFRQAQKNYTQSLIETIPKGVTTILDIGCGVGDNARALAAKGYIVTSISPDAEHQKYLQNVSGVTFCRAKFEDFNTDDRFDLVLMSESQNYFDRNTAFAKCQPLLKPNGFLLVSGLFRRSNTREFDDTNIESEYIQTASKFGLSLQKSIDITEHALPTIDFARRMYVDHLEPVGKFLGYYANSTARWKIALFKFFFSKQLKKIEQIKSYVQRRTDPDHFREHLKYVRLLLQIKSS